MSGNEHLPPKHEIVGLLGKLFPVDLTDPKTHTVKLRDLMSRFEKQLKANCSPGAHSSLHEGASRPCIPVSDMQPDDVGQVCVEAARSLAASLRARSAQISQKLRRNADTLYTAIFESLHIESFFRKVTLLNLFFFCSFWPNSLYLPTR